MNKYMLTLARAIIAIVLNSFCSVHAQMPNPMQDDRNSLLAYLHTLGDTYNCFFTIEESWSGGEVQNSLASQLVPVSDPLKDLDAALESLRAIPNIEIEIDVQNSRIIHILDRRLIDLPSYSMSQSVAHIDFGGSLGDLVQLLRNRSISISIATGFAIGDPLAARVDSATFVHVKAEQLRVRSLISLPLLNSRYSRVLWSTVTERRAEPETVIAFGGPR